MAFTKLITADTITHGIQTTVKHTQSTLLWIYALVTTLLAHHRTHPETRYYVSVVDKDPKRRMFQGVTVVGEDFTPIALGKFLAQTKYLKTPKRFEVVYGAMSTMKVATTVNTKRLMWFRSTGENSAMEPIDLDSPSPLLDPLTGKIRKGVHIGPRYSKPDESLAPQLTINPTEGVQITPTKIEACQCERCQSGNPCYRGNLEQLAKRTSERLPLNQTFDVAAKETIHIKSTNVLTDKIAARRARRNEKDRLKYESAKQDLMVKAYAKYDELLADYIRSCNESVKLSDDRGTKVPKMESSPRPDMALALMQVTTREMFLPVRTSKGTKRTSGVNWSIETHPDRIVSEGMSRVESLQLEERTIQNDSTLTPEVKASRLAKIVAARKALADLPTQYQYQDIVRAILGQVRVESKAQYSPKQTHFCKPENVEKADWYAELVSEGKVTNAVPKVLTEVPQHTRVINGKTVPCGEVYHNDYRVPDECHSLYTTGFIPYPAQDPKAYQFWGFHAAFQDNFDMEHGTRGKVSIALGKLKDHAVPSGLVPYVVTRKQFSPMIERTNTPRYWSGTLVRNGGFEVPAIHGPVRATLPSKIGTYALHGRDKWHHVNPVPVATL